MKMKALHLPFNYPYKMTMRTTATSFLGKTHFLLLLLLLAACNRSPKVDGTAPTSVFPQPQMVEASPEGGYAINPVTGDSIKPIILSSGDTLITGVPIPARGKLIHPDSVARPKVGKAVTGLVEVNAHPNRHKIPENLPTFLVDHSQIKTVKFGEGNKDFVLINSSGDTIPTGIPIPARGKTVKAIQPAPTKALPPAFKDAALTNLQYLDVDQGMGSSYLSSILEDKSGNIWFGTLDRGVSKYDGESFVHFTEAAGLSDNRVTSILEDKSGNLWFGTEGGGVSKYDGESFVHFTEAAGLSNNDVRSILEDKSGNLWFGTEGGGVSKYDGESFVHFTEAAGLSNNRVRSILEDKSGNLWFGTQGGGVSKYDGESFVHFTEAAGLSDNNVWSILEDKSGNLWFGTWGGGVSKYDGESFVHFTKATGLTNNIVLSILEDKSGNLWFGTYGGGVSKYDGESFVHFTEAAGLSNNEVSSILEDKSGNLWFGTWGGGVSKYDGESFVHFTEAAGLSDNSVLSILEDKIGNLWFGTWGGGVSKYDGESFVHFTEAAGLSGNIVWSILEDKSGNLWFGTVGGGVSRYDGESFVHFTEAAGLSSNIVRSILEDKSGNLWFGTDGGGVSKYDGESFVHFTEAAGLSNNSVRSILEDKSGNLWFGTDGGGVSRYDGESFVHFTEAAGLSDNRVWSILEDKSGNLWFGTYDGGVSKYDGESFVHFTEAAGLSNNRVRSILEDNNRNLYITTVKGLTQISPLPASPEGGEVFAIQVFGTQDGLKGLDFYHNSALIDSKNRAWWGSGKGLTMLDLNKFNPSAQIPQPLLKQLDINEQFLDYRNISDSLGNEIAFKSVQKFENYPLNLELPYHKNHLTFHFAAIDWAAPHKIRYSHRMLGLNDNWSNPTREAKADYRNLPYGTYTFQIKAIGESGVWSEPFEYTFTINPPWWHTWWAYLIYVLLFLLALRIFSKWRERKLELEKVKLEQTVEERTKELKASQAQLIQSEKMASLGELTAGIAHEIQNPLNFVNNFSELNKELVQEAKEELAKGDLEETKAILNDLEGNSEKINHHGKRADAIVKGMLAHSRSSSGEKIPTDINALADEYLRLSYHGLRARDKSFNADFKTDFDPNLPKVNVVSQDIGRVLLNLINNAFQAVHERGKKGESGYKPEVSVETKLTTKNLTLITIRDNGLGIPDSIKEKIFQPFFTTKPTGHGTGLGLSLSYDIVKAHGGEIRVESKQGEGTSFIISLPFKINHIT
ncbi:two-component regulator propeller domain-containing protein [Algoriphagus marinus]|uniref:two-component regulator propeller domain-containing protein n=1 Tax=Algoriphagus marinus TaxID=1925762 RepID=UPI0009FA8ADC|nr:two-component regulator propeller domain-containing protein [Algoriphagus marinus]